MTKDHAAHDAHSGQHTSEDHSGHQDRSGHHDHSGHTGHDMHAGHDPAMFRDRFWLSLLLSIPVVLTSDSLMMWFDYTLNFPSVNWVGPVLGTIIFLYGGQPFLVGAVGEIRARQPGMMLLIGMAITVAFVASWAASLGWFDVEVWWELSLLVVIMLLGHWMEMRAIGQARGALEALAELLPDEAERVDDDGSVTTVSISELVVDDVVLVRPGARIPADGTIVRGAADVDESMITGESNPVTRSEGERVVAASIATDGSIRVQVGAVGDDTTLAGIQQLVADAQSSTSRGQVLADRAAALLFYIAVSVAIITVVAWSIAGNVDLAVTQAVTVLIIACPHALGLAIPLVTSIATAKSARTGILVKDRHALEGMRNVDTVMFDKTGTLTLGAHALTGVSAVDGDDDALLALAAAVESDSEHPLARAIVTAADERSLTLPAVKDFRSSTGRGVEAQVNGTTIAVGGPAMLRELEADSPAVLQSIVNGWVDRGAAVLYVIRDGEVIGALALEDQVRPESRDAVAALHRDGTKVAMITGDARQVADSVAADLGIDEVFAEVLPEDKDAAVGDLRDRGRNVAMVGDGVNDAPALARADVGIAIGAGTDVAIEAAGIVLASDDPRGVVSVRTLSAATYRKMVQNLWWAAGYNIVALPLAAGALAWAGFVLPMAVGAVMMSASTIIVALNAQLLRRVDLRPEAASAE